MSARVDWSKRADYIRARHAIESNWADEAIDDAHALWLVPDPASKSGHAVRANAWLANPRDRRLYGKEQS